MATRFIPTCWICDKAITLEICTIDEHGKGVHAECYAAKLALGDANPSREKEQRTSVVEEIKKVKHSAKPPSDS